MIAAPLVQRPAVQPQSAPTPARAGVLQSRDTAVSPWLPVTARGDSLEQEADRAAEQALAAPTHAGTGTATAPHIRRAPEPPHTSSRVSADRVAPILAAAGRPLDPGLRHDMEHRFGQDFSRVRIHSDGAAEQSARSLDARAYTVGHDIVFGAGRFAPETGQGRHLLAHELAHVVQQSGTGPAGNGVHGVFLARQTDAGVPEAPRDAGPIAGVPAPSAPPAPAPAPVPARAPAPAPAPPAATIGAVTFRGSANRIAPTQTAAVTVSVSGLPAGGAVAIDVEGSGGVNGTASITAGASLSASGTVTVRGDAQTTPGNAGRLRLRATVGSTVIGRSAGFTVAAWPTDFTISRNADIDTVGGVGLRVNIGCVSDGSGALSELDEVEHTERVDIGSRDNPPFTVPGAISATGTGTSGFMAATSSSLVDSHGYGRANIVTTGLTPGFYTLVYRQNFLFNDRRTGVTNGVVRNSGFTITHSVLIMNVPLVGRMSSHMTTKRGAAVTVEGRATTAGSGSASSDLHTL